MLKLFASLPNIYVRLYLERIVLWLLLRGFSLVSLFPKWGRCTKLFSILYWIVLNNCLNFFLFVTIILHLPSSVLNWINLCLDSPAFSLIFRNVFSFYLQWYYNRVVFQIKGHRKQCQMNWAPMNAESTKLKGNRNSES